MMFVFTEYFTIFLVTFIVYLLWKSTQRPKNFPPGPALLPIVGSMPFIDKDSLIKTISKYRQKYGDIFSVKMGFQQIVYVADFHIVKSIFHTPEFSGRPDLYSFGVLHKGRRDVAIGFNISPSWRDHKRFALHHLKDFGFGKRSSEGLIMDSVKDIIADFASKKEKPFNLTMSLNLAIVSILWHMVAGHKFGRDDPRILRMLQRIEDNQEEFLGFLPDFFPIAEYLPDSVLGVTKVKESCDAIYDLCEEELRNHEKSFDDTNLRDLIDVYIKRKREDEQNGVVNSIFDDVNISYIVMVMFSAGSDTTATTLRFAFAYLITYPEIQKQLQDDIQTVVGKDRLVSLNDRSSLPYLDAFNLEVLRCSSIVPFSLPHATTKTAKLANYIIPKGTTVNVLIHDIHHNEKYWPQPEKFDPSRFLDEDGTVLFTKDGFLPFSIGQRHCLAEKFAKEELFLIVGALLQKFTFSVPPGCSPPDLTKSRGNLVVHPPDFTIVATPTQ